jgi:hypothetical protein
MSSTTHSSASDLPEVVAPVRSLPDWLREPLLHFLVLGALLFAVDHVLVGRADDPRTIIVGPEVDKEAREVFKGSRGVDPTPEQLKALRQVWLDNEVLYREGMALRLDQGDSTIRERVIFKALNIVETGVKPPAYDDKTLNEWFNAHREKYDEPKRYDFQEAILSGPNTEAAVRAFVNELNTNTPGEAKAALRVFKGRPHSNLAISYGPDFAKTLENMPTGEWRAVQTREGWRAMRVEGIAPGKQAVYESVRNVVLQDWTDEVMAAQRTTAVRALAGKYRIRYEGGTP